MEGGVIGNRAIYVVGPMIWTAAADIAQRVAINYQHSDAGPEQKLLLIHLRFFPVKYKKS